MALPLACAVLLFTVTPVVAAWTPVLDDFDPDPAEQFAAFINPFNFVDGTPIKLSPQNGIGTGGSNGIQYTPAGVLSGDEEYSVRTMPNGPLVGATDSLQQSIDFRFTDNLSQALVGMGLGEEESFMLLQAGSNGLGDFNISTYNQDGLNDPVVTALGTLTPSSVQNWFRLALTLTSTGNDVTIAGRLFDLGADGTGTPSLVYDLTTTVTNPGVATSSALSPGYRVFSAQDSIATDTTYIDNFSLVPEPGSFALAACGALLAGLIVRRRRRRA